MSPFKRSVEWLVRRLGGEIVWDPNDTLILRAGTSRREVERRLLEITLRATHGNKTETARRLGVDTRTVFRWLRAAPHEAEPVGTMNVRRLL